MSAAEDYVVTSQSVVRPTLRSRITRSLFYRALVPGFSFRQIQFLITYGIYNIFRGAFVLIGGPLYPPEAEKRGIGTETVGFVFGSLDFATFLVSLVYGKFIIRRYGPHHVIICSAFNTTLCAVLFGCLGYIDDRMTFLAMSFFVRILQGAGDAGFYPSAFTIFQYELSDMISTSVGLFELFFGVGAISGPIVCGALVDHLGFELTYMAVGGCLLGSAIFIWAYCPRPILMPLGPPKEYDPNGPIPVPKRYLGITDVVKIPAMYYAVFSLFTSAVSIGFITATLETHLDTEFKSSPFLIGVVFSVTTGIYTICSPVWGLLSDRLRWNKVIAIGSGSVFIGLGFMMLGPLDFISTEYLFWTTLVGLALHGIGIGPAIMLFFKYASESALANGFSDSTATMSLVSSLFTLTFSLGNSVGPAVSGVLYNAVGLKHATLAVIGLCILVVLSAGFLSCYNKKKGIVTNPTPTYESPHVIYSNGNVTLSFPSLVPVPPPSTPPNPSPGPAPRRIPQPDPIPSPDTARVRGLCGGDIEPADLPPLVPAPFEEEVLDGNNDHFKDEFDYNNYDIDGFDYENFDYENYNYDNKE